MLAELDSPINLQLLGKPNWGISTRNRHILNNLDDLETVGIVPAEEHRNMEHINPS